MTPPTAKRVPHVWSRPTGDVTDHYAWLADRDNPDTIDYLEAENAYADAFFADHEETIEAVYGEIRSRVQETDQSAPVPHDDWFYARQTEEGKDYVVISRGRTAETATEQVVLDVNAEAEGHDFFSLGMVDISPDHTRLAWSSDTDGAEFYDVRIRDLHQGTELDDVIPRTSAGGSAWSADGSYLFYVLPDEQHRPFRVMRHALGTPVEDDVEVYIDTDERFFVGVGASRSGEWIMIGSGSKLSSEVWVLPASAPTTDPVLVRAREDDLEYSVSHWGEQFVITTNEAAEDFRIMTAPVEAPGAWTELVPHEPGRRIVSVQTFADHLAILSWKDMQRRVEVRFRDGTTTQLDVLDEPHDTSFGANRNYDTRILRVAVESMSVPRTIYDVDVVTRESTLVKRTPTPNVDLDAYVAERLWATAEDGTRVPVDVVRHTDTPVDGTAPCLLYGYGSYEISIPTAFSVVRLSLLDRGVIFALAHPRGGGEGGRRWYTGGKLLNKRNTFTDTLAVADHLVDTGWSHPDRLGIRGGSAGGLLVGACMTMRPGRFAAVVADVPFVDIVTTMSDPTLPLTVTEWEEWGDPRSEPFASYMLSYSPYDNTVPADYPAVYITAGLNDPRVQYHEPAKWVARLREVGTGSRPILMKTEMGAGHQGPSGRYGAWRDQARTLTFILVALDA
ncbi:S9 family peptidase [Euzebya tangerina]|uniref:S9 family peptidase n=1 Tax=Euzebya tangerina TaxID=591198 RepID=UPI000E32477D|nr:S9 family peptidase [Euzebya tangerina]